VAGTGDKVASAVRRSAVGPSLIGFSPIRSDPFLDVRNQSRVLRSDVVRLRNVRLEIEDRPLAIFGGDQLPSPVADGPLEPASIPPPVEILVLLFICGVPEQRRYDLYSVNVVGDEVCGVGKLGQVRLG